MKKFIFICLFAVVAMAVNAQASYQTFTQDTTKGAETLYFTAGAKASYVGQISFEGILDGFAASDDVVVILQGSNDAFSTAKIVNIDTIPTYSSTTATPFHLQDVPADFMNYRLKCTGASGDTVLISNVLFVYKR